MTQTPPSPVNATPQPEGDTPAAAAPPPHAAHHAERDASPPSKPSAPTVASGWAAWFPFSVTPAQEPATPDTKSPTETHPSHTDSPPAITDVTTTTTPSSSAPQPQPHPQLHTPLAANTPQQQTTPSPSTEHRPDSHAVDKTTTPSTITANTSTDDKTTTPPDDKATPPPPQPPPSAPAQLWKQASTFIGADLANMRLSLPIWLFEPTTALTRMAETFEFCHLLDRAATTTDPILRDCLVSAFIISAFSHTERVRKPFNPVLGETFEYIHPVNDMKFYAEQVSHHPPISVSRAEGPSWVAGEVVNVYAHFHGNSVEVTNTGNRYIHLTRWGDRYTWTLPKATVSNLFVGGAFVHHVGVCEVTNHTTKTVATFNFAKTGWFATGRHAVTGDLVDGEGERVIAFRGEWNSFLDCLPVEEEKDENAERERNVSQKDKNHFGGDVTRLWMSGSNNLTEEEGGGPSGVFQDCTKFTKKMLIFDSDYADELPPTDSRLRPDRVALENGETTKAAEEKLRIEQLQRERRERVRKRVAEGGEKQNPKYFRRVEGGGDDAWEPVGTYWTESRTFTGEKREAASLW